VFFAAQLLGTPTERRAAVAQLTGRRSADLGAALAADGGYEELAAQDPRRAEQAGAAYRHDCISAHQHLAALLEDPTATRLPVPVTVVVATDDPHTAAARQRYRDLERLVEHVDLHEVPGGGHFFVRTCPRAAATAVLLEADLLVTT